MLSRRVLIIEDDADAAGVLEAYLRRENYDVTITGDGLAGLDMAQRWKPDLILLDVMLPGLNGTEVLASLRRKSDVPVIMVTAMGDTPIALAPSGTVPMIMLLNLIIREKSWRGCRRCCDAAIKKRQRKRYFAGTPWRWMSPPLWRAWLTATTRR
jgi:CheY-like chemotaxis protein